jgi:hypothetical protein
MAEENNDKADEQPVNPLLADCEARQAKDACGACFGATTSGLGSMQQVNFGNQNSDRSSIQR